MQRRSFLLLVSGVLVCVLALLVALVGIGRAIFIQHSDGSSIRWISNALPIPAARIGSRSILYRDYLKQHDALKHFLASPAAKSQQLNLTLNGDLEKNILEKLMAQEIMEELAVQKSVTITDADVRASFSQVVAMASSTTPDVSVYLAENFGWNEEDFRQYVIRPALLEERLAKIEADEHQGDQSALSAYMDERLKSKDAVRYLKF